MSLDAPLVDYRRRTRDRRDRHGHGRPAPQFPLKDLLDCRLAGILISDQLTSSSSARPARSSRSAHPELDDLRRGLPPRRHAALLGTRFRPAREFRAAGAGLADHGCSRSWPSRSRGLSAPRASTARTAFGVDGKVFRVLKFRSMRVDAEKRRRAVGHRQRRSRHARGQVPAQAPHRRAAAAVQCTARSTWASSVPRPERPEFVTQLNETIPYYRVRHA